MILRINESFCYLHYTRRTAKYIFDYFWRLVLSPIEVNQLPTELLTSDLIVTARETFEQGTLLARLRAKTVFIDCSNKNGMWETVSREWSLSTFSRIAELSGLSLVFTYGSATVFSSMSPSELLCEASFFIPLSVLTCWATSLSARKRQSKRLGSLTP